MACVAIEHVSKVFAGAKGKVVYAVRNLNLSIADKELLVLLGPSGCGKTTTLRLIAGLEEVSEGKIRIDEQIVNDIPPKERDVAMVFQNYALYPHMTVFENLGFGLRLRKVAKSEREARVREVAGVLGLTACLDRRPAELSGGERQRVGLGRAIVRKPKVFLFDEPLSNLDAPLRTQMRAELAALHSRLQATMLYVTHDQLEAMSLGKRIAIMKDGVIEQIGAPETIYQHPANLFVAGFIGSPAMNFFKGFVHQEGKELWFAEKEEGASASRPKGFRVKIGKSHAPSLLGCTGKDVILGLRPENIGIGSSSLADEDSVAATVEQVEHLGAETQVRFRTAAHPVAARIQAGSAPELKTTVWLAFDMSKARFFDPGTELLLC